MATRQRALEEQMAELSITVRGPEKGSNGDGGGNGGSSGSSDDRSDPQSKGSMVPRYSKMEFPTTAEGDKVGLASFHLLGEAQLWFDQMEQEETELNWGCFKEYCHVRFGPPMSNNPLGELANLKQMGSVEEYQRQFQSLLSRTSDLKHHQQVDLFTAGLVEELRIDIEMQQPGNLGIAMNMARALERKQRVSQGTPILRSSMSWPSSKNTSNSSVISANRNSNARGGGQTTKPVASSSRVGYSAPFVKRLTWAEMAERRAKGLCYNCDESYSTGHKCNRLFWIEVPDDESESEEDMAISLHAISGVRESHTMQLRAKVSGVNVLVLVDSGNTHNFLREGLIPSLGLEVLKRSGLQVYVANGERVPSMGICRSVSFMVANDIFQADFYTIPLEGFDVILGVKWLCTLGPILWDFSYMTMEFVINGKEVMWRGQGPEVAPQLSLMHGQNPNLVVLDAIRQETAASQELLHMQQCIEQGELGSDWVVRDGLIFFKGRLYMLPTSPLIPTILSAIHYMAHEGGLKTLQRLRKDFHWKAGSTRLEAVDKALQERDAVLRDARDRLMQAQQRMKLTYDSNHRELTFAVGDWVLAKVGSVAYKLVLPVGSRIHNVFHVSLLKEYKGPQPAAVGELPPVCDGQTLPTPQVILRSRLNRGHRDLLVHWTGCPKEDATWEPVARFQEAYLEFELEDKLKAEEGSDDMDAFVGQKYQRRKTAAINAV
ncbi:Retrotransposon gag domain [Sesbania bispinosa]|nr:Retrotransposon gag domain [Sesbania bispinosa]